MNYLKLIRGWIRLYVWGVCPECNHDAPNLYDCIICCYYDKLPRYKSDQTPYHRFWIWNNFKSNINYPKSNKQLLKG